MRLFRFTFSTDADDGHNMAMVTYYVTAKDKEQAIRVFKNQKPNILYSKNYHIYKIQEIDITRPRIF